MHVCRRVCCACHACPQFPRRSAAPAPLPSCRHCCACRVPSEAVATGNLQDASEFLWFSFFWPEPMFAHRRTGFQHMSGQKGNPTASLKLGGKWHDARPRQRQRSRQKSLMQACTHDYDPDVCACVWWWCVCVGGGAALPRPRHRRARTDDDADRELGGAGCGLPPARAQGLGVRQGIRFTCMSYYYPGMYELYPDMTIM